jgi:hypothetical protein
MEKYESLFEDENNIFGGTPKSKYWDIASQSNEEIVHDEFDKIVQRFAIMEILLQEKYKNEDIDRLIKNYGFEYSKDVEHAKKGLYIEFTGDIVMRLDS